MKLKRWHKIAIGAGAGVLILLVLPLLIPLETYRGRIEAAASRAAGREVAISGPLNLTFMPQFGISAGGVSIANVAGARMPQILTIDALVVGARFWPLLQGRLEVTNIVLRHPTVYLERRADGTGNWQTSTGEAPRGEGEGGFAVLRRFGIARIAIEDGRLAYMPPEGAAQTVQGVDLELRLPADGPLQLAGEAAYRGEEFSLEAGISDPDSLFADGASAAHIGLGSDIGGGRFAGRVNLKGRSDGTLRVSLPSVADAAAWAGTELPRSDPQGGELFGEFDFEGGVMFDAASVMLTGIRLRLDRLDMQGVVSMDRSAEKPLIKGELSLRRFNLDSFLSRPEGEEAEADAAADEDSHFRLDVLKEVDAEMKISLRSMVAQKLFIDGADVALTLKDGVLNADLTSLELYDGFGKASVRIDATGTLPQFRENLEVSGVRLGGLLDDAMQVDRVDGAAALTLALTSQGDSEKALLSSLAGTGRLAVTGGTVRGANLMGVARVVRGILSTETLQGVLGDTRGTEFSDLSATFTVKDGVARTNDLRLNHPSFRMNGSGTVDIANRTMDLLLEPRAPATAQLGLPDLGIPFRVRGPWDKLSYVPDLTRLPAGVMQNLTEQPLRAITDPGRALESLFGR